VIAEESQTVTSNHRSGAQGSDRAAISIPYGDSPVEVPYQSVPLSSAQEPRIAKVNIIDELIQELSDPNPQIRHKAIWELGQRGNSAAMSPLTSLLIDADSHEQGLVLAALVEISAKTLKPMNRAIAIALQDDNPDVRKNAIRDLTRIYDSMGQVGRLLGRATLDADPEVRETAHWALDQLNQLRLAAADNAAALPEATPPIGHLPEDGMS
jgi:HEAT repeat protein